MVNSCRTCSKLVGSDNPKRNFCSPDCYYRYAETLGEDYAARFKITTVVCPVCQTVVKIGGGKGGRKKSTTFCSLACKRAGHQSKSKECLEMSPTQRAYLAGIIDGEGSLVFSMKNGRSIECVISIGNTNLEVLEWVKSTTGLGTIHTAKRYQLSHKPAWQYKCTHGGATSVCASVVEFLIIKRQQARLMLEAAEMRKNISLKVDFTWQREFHQHMKDLNHRGVPVCAEEIGTEAA